MNNSDQKANARTKARGSRTAPIIELSAAEVVDKVVPETMTSPSPEPQKSEAEQVAAQPESEMAVPEAESVVTAVTKKTEVPPRSSLFLPMTFAALLGGALGTVGGSLLPSILGLGASAPNAEIQQLKQQLSALASKPTVASPEVETMRQKVQALEGDIAKRLGEAENKLAGRVQGLEGEVKTLASRPAGTTPAPVDLSPLTQRLGALESDIKTVEAKTDAGLKAADPKIAAIAQQVDVATKRMTASSAAPFFASIQGLSQAFNAGVPFITELTAVELLGGKGEDIAALRTLAEKGAPTLVQINARFAPLAGKLAQGDAKSESFALSVLEKFAKVRPVGQIGGSSPADIVTTIEAALSRGDVAGAIAAWRRLPESAKLASTDWATSAEARDKAAKVITGMQEAAMSALRMAKQ